MATLRRLAARPAAAALLAGAAAASPYAWPELARGVERRREAEAELRRYLERKQREVAEARRRCGGDVAAFGEFAERLQREVARDTSTLLWGKGVQPGAREAYVAEHGCTRATPKAVAACVARSPLVEVGAGAGHWARAIRASGADVVAYDNAASLPVPSQAPVTEVRRGDERALQRHADRTLLLVYPEGDLAPRCLAAHRGDRLVYVGEGRGGVNAPPAFFDALEREWDLEACLTERDLDPFPGGHERLFALRRREGRRPGDARQ